MIEKTIRSYLLRKMEIPILMEEDERNYEKFILIDKTGSSPNEGLTTTTLAIQSYDITLLKTAELNELLKEAMEEAVELDEITRVELNTDYNYTDTEKKRYRYQAVYQITHY